MKRIKKIFYNIKDFFKSIRRKIRMIKERKQKRKIILHTENKLSQKKYENVRNLFEKYYLSGKVEVQHSLLWNVDSSLTTIISSIMVSFANLDRTGYPSDMEESEWDELLTVIANKFVILDFELQTMYPFEDVVQDKNPQHLTKEQSRSLIPIEYDLYLRLKTEAFELLKNNLERFWD